MSLNYTELGDQDIVDQRGLSMRHDSHWTGSIAFPIKHWNSAISMPEVDSRPTEVTLILLGLQGPLPR